MSVKYANLFIQISLQIPDIMVLSTQPTFETHYKSVK